MYDATGVRLQAGRQAEAGLSYFKSLCKILQNNRPYTKLLDVLNQIVYELPAEHPLAERMLLHELLGHTPPQVIAGGLLGMVTSTIIYLISHSGNNA
ncbi:hypothetical protein Hanom_Chr17g01576311 [Helianthus anomalus]